MATTTSTGLLSFLYNVTFTPEVNQSFHANSTAEMQKFQLSKAAIAALNQMGDDRAKDEATKRQAVNVLLQCLADEILQDEYQKIW